MKRTLYYFLLSALIGMAVMVSCRSRARSGENIGKTPVTLAEVEKKEFARPIHTYGRLSTKKEIKLSFKTGGIIREITVDEGQKVVKGQLLARLNLAEIEAQVGMAREGYEKAKRDLKRVKNLFQDKVATLEQFQDVQTAFQLAESQYKAAEFNLRFSEIRAPSKGRILKRVMEENELIGPGMPVFLFGSTDKDWVVRAGVSDRDLLRLRLGDRARIEFDPYPGEIFAGMISEIAEAPDPYTGTYEVELTVERGEKKLLTGLVSKVELLPNDREPLFLIPVQALVSASGERGTVYTVDTAGKTAIKKEVIVAFLFNHRVAVRSGLEGCSHVIAEGAAYVAGGVPVEVVEKPSGNGNG